MDTPGKLVDSEAAIVHPHWEGKVEEQRLPAFEILSPQRWTSPAVFNSPHSGRRFPQHFLHQTRLPVATLRKSEDCYVDELFGDCTALGAPLLRALVPRSYIDLNREPYELDPRMFTADLPGDVNSGSPRVAGGLGTIPRVVAEGEEIYRGRIAFAEARQRINNVYFPYHRTLTALVNAVRDRMGEVLLVDCHSMPCSATAHVGEGTRVDVVIGDRFGASCGEDLSRILEAGFRRHGLRVLRNKPYAGGFITQNHGAPGQGKHAVQIELNRSLYMNEASFEKLPDFDRLRAVIAEVIASLLTETEGRFAPSRLAAE